MLKRTVNVEICNETTGITLKNPRCYVPHGNSYIPPSLFIPPGSSERCQFSNSLIGGCRGVLVYEAGPCTLVIYFSNPLFNALFPLELGLEVSLLKTHMDTLENIYTHMAERTLSMSNENTASHHVKVDTHQEPARVSLGPIQVMAMMSSDSCSTVRVVEIPEPRRACAEMLKRTVKVEICNETTDITLENPRTYFYSGHSSVPPGPSVPPGSNMECQFTSPTFRGCVGVLVYEAKAFTLAIYFCNPLDYNLYSMELGLELSLLKIHLDTLENIYNRMAGRTPPVSSEHTVSHRVKLDTCQEPARVSLGPVKVAATMSNDRRATIKVVVRGQEDPGKGGKSETPCPGKKFCVV
ncbi:hypothetical protein WISP_01428 [Willisornis vidua]|uniref:Uncharacterized protein n=1 Tax=Willisornis vidua TaxID=1566151 RepID=A0ABQ9E028_9PASS|nr:hypothetical protein WISP_01428 [Willisornis vidua]